MNSMSARRSRRAASFSPVKCRGPYGDGRQLLFEVGEALAQLGWIGGSAESGFERAQTGKPSQFSDLLGRLGWQELRRSADGAHLRQARRASRTSASTSVRRGKNVDRAARVRRFESGGGSRGQLALAKAHARQEGRAEDRRSQHDHRQRIAGIAAVRRRRRRQAPRPASADASAGRAGREHERAAGKSVSDTSQATAVAMRAIAATG